MTVRIVLVAAVAENGVIGRDNDMPWRLPSDLRHFRAVTMGKPVIMGRKTFESIGRALPGRDNLVVTRNTGFLAPGAELCHSLDAAITKAESLARDRGVAEICVIGGGTLYAAAIDRAARLHITEVKAAPEGAVRFPEIDLSEWREVAREGPIRHEGDSATISFVVYERAAPSAPEPFVNV